MSQVVDARREFILEHRALYGRGQGGAVHHRLSGSSLGPGLKGRGQATTLRGSDVMAMFSRK